MRFALVSAASATMSLLSVVCVGCMCIKCMWLCALVAVLLVHLGRVVDLSSASPLTLCCCVPCCSSFTVKPVKFSFNGDIRRVRLDDAATRSFATFMTFVKATFPVLASASVSPTVQYEDDEAELITIGSDAELSEAFRLAATDGRPSLRFIVGALPAATDAVKRAKTDDVSESPADAALPAAAAPPAPVRRGQGVPMPKLLALVDLLRQEYRGNPLPLVSAAMGLMSEPAAAGAVARLLPLISDIPALLAAVSRDPVLRLVLSQPPVLPFLAAVDIELDDCVVGEPAASAPAAGAPDASAFLPSLLQQFAGLGFAGPCAPASSRGDVGVTAASVGELPVHTFVTCDGCGMSPIIGSRFKCDVCPDFDLCGRCFGRPDAHPHACTLIEHPVGYEPSPAGTVLGGKPVHIGVTCDGCNLNPIVGARFKCTVCTNYDLCESCEAADVHPLHPLLKIRDASQTPAKLIAVLRPEQLPAEVCVSGCFPRLPR